MEAAIIDNCPEAAQHLVVEGVWIVVH